ncbi:hypothetical protein F4677DRAFT_183928 [Hypoxylon crocopeplum]|nr:hypothetical protein F4677DRAFT_183928 [Hypoxylon crocopeplum]
MLSLRKTCAFGLSWLIQGACAQDSSPSGPTMPNTVKNCNLFWTVLEGSGDSCWSITQQFSITLDQFYTWNPDVGDDCGANFWPGYSYCVGIDPNMPTTTSSSSTISSTSSTASTSSSTTSSATSNGTITSSIPPNTEPYTTNWPITNWTITPTTIETGFPPQRTQPGQPPACNNWYYVNPADTCDSVVSTNSWLTLENLHAWNPTLDSDCSGLYAGWWLCIGVPTTSTDEFGWTTTDAPADVPTFAGNYTFTTLPEVDSTFVAEPTQTGIVSGCLSYYQAQDGDSCRNIVDDHYLTEEDFMAMNPALNGNCGGLWLGYYYCVVGPSGITAMPPTATSPPATIPSGQTGECRHWYQREGESCADIVSMFGIFSLSDFRLWNPSLGSESCEGIADDVWYCVGIPGTPTTRTGPVPTTTGQPLTPTQSGMVTGCTKLWLVSSADTCDSIISVNGLSADVFYQWNPAVGSGSCDNLTPNFYVCVAVDDSASLPPSTTTASPTSTTTSAITTPTPVQAGMVSGCRRFYMAQPDDGCWAIANSAGISLDDFYAWNLALGTDCTDLWPDTWYCIGIAGPVTTISSGPPVPTS